MAVSSGYGGPNYSQIEGNLRNVALQFTAIVEAQRQIAASIDTWRELERQLALAQAAAGGTRADFQSMEVAARNFALASTYSVTQVSQAFYSLASAGLSVKETLAASTGVILLAQATLEDLGSTSETVAASLAQFNLQAGDSYRVANLLVAATNSSLATLPKLSFALKQVGPAANEMGLSIEETVAILDKLFDAGMRGEQAGTALRNNLMRLTDPRGIGGLAMRNLGIEQTDPAGNMRSYIDRMQDLSKVNPNQATLTQIFGLQGATAARIQLEALQKTADGTTNSLKAHEQEISNTDAAYRQAAIQMNTLDGQMKLMGNAFNDMRIMVGQAVAPAIEHLGGVVTGLDQSLRNLTDSQRLNLVSWILAVAQFGIFLKLAQNIGMAFFNTAAAGKAMTATIAEMRLAMAATRAENLALNGTSELGIMQWAANAQPVVKGLISVIGGLISTIAGIAALTAVVVELGKAWQAAADAAEEAHVKGVTDTVLQRGASAPNINPLMHDTLTDQTDVTGTVKQQIDALDAMAKINPQSGENAYQRLRMVNSIMDQIHLEIGKLQWQYHQISVDFKANHVQQQALLDAIKDEQSPTVGPNAEMQLALHSQDMAQSIASRMQTAGQAPAANLRAAIIGYHEWLIAQIKSSHDIGVMYKPRMLEQQNAIIAQLRTANDDALGVVAKAMADAGKSAATNKYLGVTGISGFGVKNYSAGMRDMVDAYVTGITNSLVLTRRELSDKQAALKSQRDTFQADLHQLQLEMPQDQAMLGAEILTTVQNTNTLSASQMGQLRTLMNSAQGQSALKTLVTDMRDHHLTQDAVIKEFGDLIGAQRLGIKVGIDKAMEKGLAVPLIDERKQIQATDQAKIDLIKEQIRAAQLSGSSNTVGLLKQQAVLETEQATKRFVDDFFQSLDASKDSALEGQLDKLRDNPTQLSALEKLFDQLNTAKPADQQAIQDKIMKLMETVLLPAGMRFVPGAIREANIKLQAAKLAIQNELQQGSNRSNKTLGIDDQILRGLLNLPTQEDMYLQTEKLRQEAQFGLSTYFNLPIDAATKAYNDVVISSREKYISLQKQFAKSFTDVVAKGMDTTATNQDMRDAFSGKLLQQILGSTPGTQTDVFGTKFTAQMVQTAEGMQQFVDVVSKNFGDIVISSKTDRPNDRITAAKQMLTGMVGQMVATWQSVDSSIDVATLQMEEAQRKAAEFVKNFKAQAVLDELQSGITAGGGTLRAQVGIDVALNARIAEVTINAHDAVDKVRQKYVELFRNLNVPVRINPQTGLFEVVNAGQMHLPPAPIANVSNYQGQYYPASAPKPASLPDAYQHVGNGTVPQAWVTFFEQTLPAQVAKGFAAALFADSGGHLGFTKQADGGFTFGAAQWRGDRARGAAAAAGPGNLEGQLQYALNELLGKTAVGGISRDAASSILHASNAMEAMTKTIDLFLRPGPGRAGDVRRGAAVLGYKHVAGTGQSTGSDGDLQPEKFDPVALFAKVTGMSLADAQAYADQANRAAKEAADNAAIYAAIVTESVAGKMGDSFARASKAFDQAWQEQRGRVYQNAITRDTAQADMYGAMGRGAGLGSDAAQARTYRVQAEINNLLKDRDQLLHDIDHSIGTEILDLQIQLTGEVQGSARYKEIQRQINTLLLEQVKLHHQINDATAQQIANAGRTATSVRNSLQADMADAEGKYNMFGLAGDPMQGLRQAVRKFASELPTMFETARDVAYTALSGIADIGSALFTGTEQNARQAVASMLRSMAQLIAKMVIMWGIIQLISAIPGGSAVLAALGMGAQVGSAAMSGFNSGSAIASSSTGNMIYTGAGSLATPHATGGIARSPQLSLFGEGRLPEAYVPLTDHHNIPVRINDNGDIYVPLPGGGFIPAKLEGVKKFAAGGIGGYNSSRARRADMVSWDSGEAVGRHRGGMAAPTNIRSEAHNTFKFDLHFHGTAPTKDDGGDISRQIAEALDQMLSQREHENARRQARNRGSIGDQYGVFG